MNKGLYLKGVLDLLKLSESKIDELVDQGHLICTKQGRGKRVFSKDNVREFKTSKLYRTLVKQPVLGYVRAETRGVERQVKRDIKNYCKENNFKATIICQLDRGKNEITNRSFNSAIDCIFESDLSGLIYFGTCQDVLELKNIFQAREQAFIVNASNIRATKAEVVESPSYQARQIENLGLI